jgi:hypothetical protein
MNTPAKAKVTRKQMKVAVSRARKSYQLGPLQPLTITKLSTKARLALELLKKCRPGKSDRQIIEACILATYEAVVEEGR